MFTKWFYGSIQYVLLLLLVGCSVGVDVNSDTFADNTRIKPFTSPASEDFTSSTYYDFSWPAYEMAGSTLSTKSITTADADTPPASALYHLSIFKNATCSGRAEFHVDQNPNEYRLILPDIEDTPMTLGVQVRFTDGTLGPLACSAPVEKDTSLPNITLTKSEVSPLRSANLTLNGTCSDNKRLHASPVHICIKPSASCTPSDYTLAVACNNGTFTHTFAPLEGYYDIRAYALDHANNKSPTPSLGLVIVDRTQPSAVIYSQPTVPTTIGANTFMFSWASSDVGLAGMSLTNPYTWSLYTSTNCSGGATSTGNATSAHVNITTLADSNIYTLGVVARDEAGNVTSSSCSQPVSVVMGAPSLALTDTTNTIVPNQALFAKTPNVTATITSDTAATGWCLSETQSTAPSNSSCSGSSWVSTRPTSFTLSTGDGTKTVYLWIKDSLDNVISSGTVDNITLDTEAPTLTYSSPADSSHHNTSATITGACESNIPVEFSGVGLAANSSASCPSGTFSHLVTFSAGEGSKSITITQTDSASNSTSVSRSFINDTIDPVITIVSPAALTELQSTVTLAGACETGLAVNISGTGLASGSSVSCTSGSYSATVNLSTGEGNKPVIVSQTDLAGNVGSSTRTFVRDNTAPELTQTTLTSPHYTNTDSVTFGGACEIGYSVTIKRGVPTENTIACPAGTWTYTVDTQTTDASYDYTFEQIDAAGNPTSVTAQWIRDTEDPTLTLTAPTALITFGNAVTFTGTCEDGLPNPIAVTTTDTSTATCTASAWSYTVATQTTDAARTYNFTLTDRAGNTTTVTGTWTRTSSAPTLALSDATNTIVPNQTIHAKTTSISAIISGDSGATAWCLSETQSTAPTAGACSGTGWLSSRPTTFTLTSPQGAKTVHLWLKDDLNQVLSSTSNDSITLDTLDPSPLTITTPAASSPHNSSVTFTGTCETGLSVVFTGTGIQSAPVTASCPAGTYSQALSLTAGEGTKNVVLTVTDSASNSTQTNRDVVNDTLPPTLTITSPAINFNTTGAISLQGACEIGLNISFSGDISAQTPVACPAGTYSVPLTLTTGEGPKTVTVSQTDAALNTTNTSRTFVRDTLPPALTQVDLATPYYSNTDSVTYGGYCESGYSVVIKRGGTTENSVACMADAWSYTVNAQTVDNTYSYTFEQTDAAGNTGSASAQWTRDVLDPTLNLNTSSHTGFRDTYTFSGTCEFGLPGSINITGTDTTTTTCNMGGIWSYTVATQTTNALRTYNFSYTDLAGNNTTVTGTWTRNVVAPTLVLTDSTNTIVPNQTAHAKTTSISVSVGAVAGTTGWCLSETQSTEPAPGACAGSSWVASTPTSMTLSTPDGAKTVYVWLRDSTNKVSSLGQAANMTLDRDAPTVAYTGPAVNSVHDSVLTITGTCESGIAVNITGGVATPVNATCSGGTFSQIITLSTGEGNKTVNITQTDAASNSSSASRIFVNDTLDPILTIASPAADTRAQASVNLTGVCETGLNIQFSGALLSTINQTCTGGTYSQTVFFSAGDGNKSVSAMQVDAAGNTTTITRNYVRDNVAPTITQTTLTYPYYSNTNSVTFGGACETGLTVSILRGGSPDGTTSCTAGAWSYAVATQSADATYNYSFEQSDTAGNLGTNVGRWIRDTLQPSLTISNASQLTSSNAVTFTGTCESGLPNPIAVSGTDTNTATCSAGSWSYTVATQTTDAIRTYTFTLTDQAGNPRAVVGTWERNTNYPNLTITSAVRVVNTANTATFSGNCAAGITVEARLGGSLENTTTCAAGTWSYTTASQTTDDSRVYQFRQTNAVPLSTNVNGTWIRDTTAPVFTVGQMNINNNAVETNIARVDIKLQAADALTNITHFCLKLESSQPFAGDSCFVGVDSPSVGLTPGLALNLVNFKYNLPIVPDAYNVYAWLKDEANNVSVLTSAGAGTALRDTDSINFVVYVPPTVTQVVIGSNDYPADPPSPSDLTVGAGQGLYIKWKAVDDKALGGTPITVQFTTNDVDFTNVATGLVNGQNGACTVDHGLTSADNGSTGCYFWSSVPVGGFLRVRIVAQDTDNLTAGANSVPLNVAANLRFLAGNTDPGTNLSAQASLFLSTLMDNAYSQDNHSLVISREGTVFFKDSTRGILKVDPSDGVQRIYIPTTGTSSGDGGPATSATLHLPYKIALDQHFPTQRLWIFDHSRIRRVDLDTGIITTVIGGGTDNNDTVVNPLNARIDYPASNPDGWKKFMPFFSMPNGDFYYIAGNDGYYDTRMDAGTYRVKYFEASSGQIKSFKATSISSTSEHASGSNFMECHQRGMGFGFDPNTSLLTTRLLSLRYWPHWGGHCSTLGDGSALVSLDTNGVGAGAGTHPPKIATWMEHQAFHTGLDGALYSYSKSNPAGIWKFIPGAPGTWTQILGHVSGQAGECADFTNALSCRTAPHDLFVQENGTVYFLDAGRIRTIAPSGAVITLMGQGTISADSGLALGSRLGTSLREFRTRSNGAITFTTLANHSFYEFLPGSTIARIAGTGTWAGPSLNVDATTTPIALEHPHSSGDDFAMDPATGDLYHSTGAYWGIRKLTRYTGAVGSTGEWTNFLGGGTNHWSDPASDGQSNISFNSNCTFGFDPGVATSAHCWIYPQATLIANNKLLIHSSELTYLIAGSYVPHNSMMKLYDLTTKVQTHLVGSVGITGGNKYDFICPDGTLLGSCDFLAAIDYRTLSLKHDSVSDAYWAARIHTTRLTKMVPGSTMQSYTMSHGIRGFTYRREGATEYIYYCSNTTGEIRRRNLNTSVETALSWPVSSITCETGSMEWNAARGSVIFIYRQNGLMGLAEYLDPTP